MWANSLVPCRLTSLDFLNRVIETGVHCSVSEDDIDPLQALVDMLSLVSSQCELLEPFQTCHHLSVIALQTTDSVTLADNDLENMVNVWQR